MDFKKRIELLSFNVIVMIFMTLVFFALLEVGARVAMAIYTKDSKHLTYCKPFELIKVYKLRMKSYLGGKDLYYKGIPNFAYTQIDKGGHIVRYNSKGYRTNEFEDSKLLIKIACFGGSSTWGCGNNNNETWPASLQEYINKFIPDKYEVINSGFGGYDTTLILNLIKNEFINYKPDIIIIYTGYNEHTGGQSITFSNSTKTQIFIYNVHRFLSARSVFYYACRRFYSREFKLGAINAGNQMLKIYKKNIEEIINICQTNKVKLVLVKQPLYVKSPQESSAEPGELFFKYYKNPYFGEETYKVILDDLKKKVFYAKYGRTYYYQSLIFKAIDEVKARNKEIAVIDIVNRFISRQEKGELFFSDVVHLTPIGNDFLAKSILENAEFKKLLAQEGAFR